MFSSLLIHHGLIPFIVKKPRLQDVLEGQPFFSKKSLSKGICPRFNENNTPQSWRWQVETLYSVWQIIETQSQRNTYFTPVYVDRVVQHS